MLQLAQMELVSPKLIRLDFENLRPFERLTDQYRHFGVHFSSAIAIEPSNPAFTPKSGAKLLMPMGNMMSLNAFFDKPSSWVGAFVCSTRIVVLSAYDRDGNFLGQTSTISQGTNLADEQSEFCPQQLDLNRSGIAKVEFHSCVPFTLDDFFFAVMP
ncbi:hypothetical protein [Aerosakkonema funiforme]|uniref:Uncharacterized protein n=1 Tax=Aerosakkonema funiforme FACHB-1375 TaxID=2949571 RepID=A0A926VMC7_9CYAN|nr:hypothetical protein [Aerosakkonema funiforme]MBD2186343.1 hypothetical protein [Aerosakkonema funiforme FACHB-1375]